MDTRFQESTNRKEEYITPAYIIDDLGPFDLDPAAPPAERRPRATARIHYSDNGLSRSWADYRVWCNPPYNAASTWLQKCAEHGNAIALVFARTETRFFHEHVWQRADALLFLKGRLYFEDTRGNKVGRSGAGSVLVAYGNRNAASLRMTKQIRGHYLTTGVQTPVKAICWP